MKILYNALARTQLEYASTVWSHHHQNWIDAVGSAQKQFLIFYNGDDKERKENNYNN